MILGQLRPEAQATYAYDYQRYSKDSTVALLLTLCLGIVGGEAYYFGDYKRGILMTLALFSGVGTLISIPLWIVRCFTIQNECEGFNDYVAYMLAARYWPQNCVTAAPPGPPQDPAPRATRRQPIGGVPMRVR
jgi:hypothetical protein